MYKLHWTSFLSKTICRGFEHEACSYHLYSGVIYMLSHSVLLKHIYGRCLFLNVMIFLSKRLNALETNSPPFYDETP